jgi:membrane protease YdiL (CAAX protease family)
MLYLMVEFLLIFIAFPLSLYFYRQAFGAMIVPALLSIAGICLGLLIFDPTFDRRRLFNFENFGSHVRRILITFIPLAAGLALVMAIFRPQMLFYLPAHNPGLWLLIIVLYPLFSVYPQEIIFRTFLFHRYQPLFPSKFLRIFVSGLTFGLAHLFFANWLAPTMTAVGGILFARTYAETNSTIQASVEHGLWGNLIFTIGLGLYFYGGAIN